MNYQRHSRQSGSLWPSFPGYGRFFRERQQLFILVADVGMFEWLYRRSVLLFMEVDDQPKTELACEPLMLLRIDQWFEAHANFRHQENSKGIRYMHSACTVEKKTGRLQHQRCSHSQSVPRDLIGRQWLSFTRHQVCIKSECGRNLQEPINQFIRLIHWRSASIS